MVRSPSRPSLQRAARGTGAGECSQAGVWGLLAGLGTLVFLPMHLSHGKPAGICGCADAPGSCRAVLGASQLGAVKCGGVLPKGIVFPGSNIFHPPSKLLASGPWGLLAGAQPHNGNLKAHLEVDGNFFCGVSCGSVMGAVRHVGWGCSGSPSEDAGP